MQYATVEKNENLLRTKIQNNNDQNARNRFSCVVKLPTCFGVLDYRCKFNCINGHRWKPRNDDIL